MTTRMRSPSYPSTSLQDAIELIRKLHQVERSNPIDRDVAAKALGYVGITGRSATVLSNLIQYGLLEKTGKNEVRVTRRAVEILHPDSPQSKADAIRDAAREPELYQKVMERFADGLPSANALHSYFIKEGFTDSAIPAAIRAFQETASFVENAIENDSHSHGGQEQALLAPNQLVEAADKMQRGSQAKGGGAGVPPELPSPSAKKMPDYRFFDDEIWLSGVVTNRQQAKKVVEFINAVMPLLKSEDDDPVSPADAPGTLPISGPKG